MTATQMDTMVRFWMDLISSPRIDADQMNAALNSAQDRYIDEQCGVFNTRTRIKSVQLTRDSRDHLRPLIIVDTVNVIGNNLLDNADLPTGAEVIRYIIDINAIIGGQIIPTDPIDYKTEKKLQRNPYRRPRLTYPQKIYYNESADGYRLILPAGTVCSSAQIIYVKEPVNIDTTPASLVDSELPSNCHSVVCRYAAENLALSIGNHEKLKVLKEFITESA